LNEEVEKVE
jgi:adiponectin receptor